MFWKHLGFGRPPAPAKGDEEKLVFDVEAMAGDEGFGFGGLVVREDSNALSWEDDDSLVG